MRKLGPMVLAGIVAVAALGCGGGDNGEVEQTGKNADRFQMSDGAGPDAAGGGAAKGTTDTEASDN